MPLFLLFGRSGIRKPFYCKHNLDSSLITMPVQSTQELPIWGIIRSAPNHYSVFCAPYVRV